MAVAGVCAAAAGQISEAPAPKKAVVLRSGEVIQCVLKKGCTEDFSGGHRALRLEADGYIVLVSMTPDGKLFRADVAVTNQTSIPVNLQPADFRLEATDARLRKTAPVTGASTPHTSAEARPGHGLPPPDYWTSAEHKQDMEELRQANTASFPATTLKPADSANGRVFFKDPAGSRELSLIVPVGGSVFEFPYTSPEQHGKKKHRRKGAPVETPAPPPPDPA